MAWPAMASRDGNAAAAVPGPSLSSTTTCAARAVKCRVGWCRLSLLVHTVEKLVKCLAWWPVAGGPESETIHFN